VAKSRWKKNCLAAWSAASASKTPRRISGWKAARCEPASQELRRGVSDKTRFLNIAQGSLEECRYYLILIQDLGYGATADMEALLEEVSKLLVAYAKAIESNR
jgi:hypothetical protein